MSAMKGYEVISVNPVVSNDAVRSHGDCRSYSQAASLARIAKRAFPERTVLVKMPRG